jgi:hypothetical protein
MTAPQESKEHLLIKQLIANVRCAACQHYYDMEDIQVVGRQGDLWLLKVICGHCHSRGWALALIKEMERPLETAEFLPDESAHFSRLPAIDAEEVLDFHEFLRDFDGDVYDLLEALSGEGLPGLSE